ncbi:uncharacterized protein LOC134230145 [Saccostrea cucullata]|uniref:uncharacterized protein LOC134230145 n=1 Tax=Saccostrea cuccullata TaxID=36930 RepID=UPI002ED6B391
MFCIFDSIWMLFRKFMFKTRDKGLTNSTLEGQNAQLGIDGVKTPTSFKYCSHTSTSEKSEAWYQVDLGNFFSLKNIIITYRNEEKWPPYRFRQFYLDVSSMTANSTETLTPQRVRCYTDRTRPPATPPNVIDIPCNQTARYVIVETFYDATEDREILVAILEICEIEIYGCAVCRYGINCSECDRCSVCDIISGACPLASSDRLDPASVGVGIGVGVSFAILVCSVIAIVICFRMKRRKGPDNKYQKEHENKNAAFNRNGQQRNFVRNVSGFGNMDNASGDNADVYENEKKNGFKTHTDDKVSHVHDKYGLEPKKEYLSVSEKVQEESTYDQLEL